MNKWILIVVCIIVWIMLYFLVLLGGLHIVETHRKQALKKWKAEDQNYDLEKWKVRFYTSAFFIGIPLLLAIALYQEFK